MTRDYAGGAIRLLMGLLTGAIFALGIFAINEQIKTFHLQRETYTIESQRTKDCLLLRTEMWAWALEENHPYTAVHTLYEGRLRTSARIVGWSWFQGDRIKNEIDRVREDRMALESVIDSHYQACISKH